MPFIGKNYVFICVFETPNTILLFIFIRLLTPNVVIYAVYFPFTCDAEHLNPFPIY